MKLKIDPIIAAMLVMMAVLFVLVAYFLVQPEPGSKVLLTNEGCEAVARLGQMTTKLPAGCEVENVVNIGWNWVSYVFTWPVVRIRPGGAKRGLSALGKMAGSQRTLGVISQPHRASNPDPQATRGQSDGTQSSITAFYMKLLVADNYWPPIISYKHQRCSSNTEALAALMVLSWS